ncbi:HAMP domain-containing protein [Streptomyces sp. TRM66268-LWL]|uniref:histidine kinase n=1 Tax=Streptomyces polyasparticus TaxID=2767826 RepID=A0ABR7SG83_9ACTN|nr:ATP-binding protein [Streptomyces polyasparticus]MBC9713984.1 HAMP domain-containing protein [Streptomyces polyasparticus]
MRLPRFPRASVRVKATIGAVAVVALALGIACAALLTVTRHGLTDSAERTAKARAEAVAAAAAKGKLVERLAVPDGEDSLLQVVTDDGRILAASENLTGRGPVAGFVPSSDSGAAARTVRVTSAAADGGAAASPYRLVAVRGTESGRPVTVYAGTSLRTAEYTARLIRDAMVPGIPLLLALVAAVTWRNTARALRPVEAIRAEVAEITERDLGRRVPVPASRDEVARLSTTMNDTLDRLEESMDRQRRFVADASHELRNPIAALRAHVEVAIAHPQLLHGDELLSDVVRVQQLADDLLLLARLDAGDRPDHTLVALGGLAKATVERRAGDRVPVTLDVSGDAPVLGSRTRLTRVLDNLLDNAQRHARSRITVTVTAGVLEVTDDGSGIPAAEREHVFTRFTRLDESRSRDAGGTGLGLAIARDIASAHGGTLRAEEPREGSYGGPEGEGPSGGARIVLRLPTASVSTALQA